MATKVGGLLIDMVANTASLKADLDKAARDLNSNAAKMNKSLARLERGFEKSRKAASRMAKGLAAGAFAAATAALNVAGKRSIDFADRLAKAAQTADISAERFQTLTFAFGQMGIEARQTEDGLRRFNRRIGEFANSGGGPAAKALEQLGIETRALNGDLLPTEQILNQTLQRLAAIEEPARRAAFAAQLFGDDAGPKLALAVSQGTSELQRLESQAIKMGLVLDNELISNAEALSDKFDVLGQIIRTKFTAAIIRNAPALTKLADGFVTLVDSIGNATQAWSEFLGVANATEETALLRQSTKLSQRLMEIRDQIREIEDSEGGFLNKIFGDAQAQERLKRRRADEQAVLKALADTEAKLAKVRASSDATAQAASGSNASAGIPTISVSAPDRSKFMPTRKELASTFDTSPLQRFSEALGDINSQMELSLISTAARVEDAFVELALTGQFSFKKMANFIISEIVRIAVRAVILKPLFGLLDGLPGIGGLFGGARAMGGPVDMGKAYLVGEKGPELFVPGQSGTIIPNSTMPSAAPRAQGNAVNINIDARGAQDGLIERLRATLVTDVVPLITTTVDGRLNGLARPIA
ncbi:MAG: phage tail tape measure protein [Pseudomonadota bacterium]